MPETPPQPAGEDKKYKYSYKEYVALQEEADKKKANKFKLPPVVKWILLTPVMLLFGFLILYVPILVIKMVAAMIAQKSYAEF